MSILRVTSRHLAVVMAGLVPSINAKHLRNDRKAPAVGEFQLAARGFRPPENLRRVGVDGRDKPGHDVVGARM